MAVKKKPEKPFFSVVTVCYNASKTIEKTIQSVLNQNFKDFEYIIVDGGSTDATMEIVGKYQNDISTIISEPDEGPYDAMNKGIKVAKGRVIGIINSDDWYEPDTLKLVANEINDSVGNIVIHGLCKYYHGNKEGKILAYHHDVLLKHNIAHPTCFVPKSLYEQYGLFIPKFYISGDYELLLRLYLNDVPFKRIERVLANFRSGGNTSQFRITDEKAEIQLLHNLISKRRYRLRHIRQKYQRLKSKVIEILYKRMGL